MFPVTIITWGHTSLDIPGLVPHGQCFACRYPACCAVASRANTTTEEEFILAYAARVVMVNDAQSVQYHADVLIIITILEYKTHDTLRRTTQRFMHILRRLNSSLKRRLLLQ
jgi:hypothetical protein